jgi:sugar phosphate isomerase/epimerase
MKLGVFTVLFAAQPLAEALDYIKKSGLDAVEIGVGNYPGDAHCPLNELVKSAEKARRWKESITGRGLEISALSCHGNPLHPDAGFARKHRDVFEKAVRLAEMLDVRTVINFSGCPGSSDKDSRPNWVTCPWPPDFSEILKWQWEEKVIPYWRKAAKFARDHGVKLAFEMHPGFVVYNTETLLGLRRECGANIGANFDPSHLFWQGMDPVASVRALQGCIYHVHAKDCRIYPVNSDVNGVLDTKPYGDEIRRSWIFRTVGYGHGREFWADFVSTLRMVGYDGVLSIEHEDSLMSVNEGFQKAVAFLKDVLLREKPGTPWWA